MTDRRQNPDHDLLIVIDTKLGRVIDDVKELKDNFATRVTDLEENKVSKDEFNELVKEHKVHGAFIDNLKGKYSVYAIIIGVLISIVTAYISKKI
jgi:hypothetical protein